MKKQLQKHKSPWIENKIAMLQLIKISLFSYALFLKNNPKRVKLEQLQEFQKAEQLKKDFCKSVIQKFHLDGSIFLQNHQNDFTYFNYADCYEDISSRLVVNSSTHESKTQPHGKLIVSNHRSALDILFLTAIFGGKFVSRADVEHWPLFGKIAKAVNTIFVDRQNPLSGATTIRKIRDQLKRGHTVIVFPEGKTHKAPHLGEFHRGVFLATHQLHCSIVPVGIAYPSDFEYVDKTFTNHLLEILKHQPIPVQISIGTAFVPMSTSKKTCDAAHEKVKTLLSHSEQQVVENKIDRET